MLAQQEALLKAKQQQLEDEQTHHRTRLDYFAEKGHFPPTCNQGSDLVLNFKSLLTISYVLNAQKQAFLFKCENSFLLYGKCENLSYI